MPQAIVMRAYGDPEVLRLEEVAVGSPGPRQIRVRHTCIGVNFHDIYVRSGLYKTLALPGTPGIEATGVVQAVGAEVSEWQVGDRIAYVTGAYGVYAGERLIDAGLVDRIPDGVSDETAASALLRGLTTDMLVSQVHAVRPGQHVLVQAAAGGMGQLVSQWAAQLGAVVIGTAGSAQNQALARQAGCRHVIAYREEGVGGRVAEITQGHGVAVVYDAVGKDTFQGSLASLGLRGHLVNYGQASGPVPPVEVSLLAAKSNSLTRPIVFHYLQAAAERSRMVARVFSALEQGWLKVRPPRCLPLEQAAEAHRLLAAHGASTPLLLRP